VAALELILLLLAASAALRLAASRLAVPYAVLLVVGGLALAFTPGLPHPTLPPEVLFLIFVPPLLYAGALSFPLRDFRQELGPILRLAILMPIVSIFAVAATAHAMDPVFTWAAAFTLGAIVSFPDPVAVLSVLRSVRVAREIETILEGEGLLNDAVGIIAYRFAVAAAVTNTFSPGLAFVRFLFSAAAGIAIGIAVGYASAWGHRISRPVSVVQNTVSLLTPFASFLAADLVGASGVVAVVTTGMYLSRALSSVSDPGSRLERDAVWTVIGFLLESLIFILVGLELPVITRQLATYSIATILRQAAIITACVVLVRLIWVVPSAYAGRFLGRLFRGTGSGPAPFRWILFVAWTGLRGGDSVVIALALPTVTASGAPFPARAQIMFIAFAVTFATLVVQGPTLAPLARWLCLRGNGREDEEEAHARLAAAEAGLSVLDSAEARRSPRPEVVRYLGQRHRQRARRWAAREAALEARGTAAEDLSHDHHIAAPSHDAGEVDEQRATEYRRLRSEMLDAEQRALVEMRDRDEIPDDVMRRVQRDLDLEAMLLESPQPVASPLQEVAGEVGEPEPPTE
jgi:CPA1 family monovalent cation:H+ antiporter